MLYLIIALLVPVLIFAGFYNSFAVRRNNVENAFAAIDTQLKKRCDLIPNLAAAVKTYQKQENGTLQAITQFRAQTAASGVSAADRMNPENKINHGVRNLMVQLEAYPDPELKALDNFMQLQRPLSEIDEQLPPARQAYNATPVTYCNNAVMLFSGSIFAKGDFQIAEFLNFISKLGMNVCIGSKK